MPPEMWVDTPFCVRTRILAVPSALPATRPVLELTTILPVPCSALNVNVAGTSAPLASTAVAVTLIFSFRQTVSASGRKTSLGSATTVSVHVAFLLLKVFTVIFVVPGATAVTTPVSLFTVATFLFAEV